MTFFVFKIGNPDLADWAMAPESSEEEGLRFLLGVPTGDSERSTVFSPLGGVPGVFESATPSPEPLGLVPNILANKPDAVFERVRRFFPASFLSPSDPGDLSKDL